MQCIKFILLVTSNRNEFQTCINQKGHHLVHIPEEIKIWSGFLHDRVQSFEQCHL